MNICGKKEKKEVIFTPGHIYRRKKDFFICVKFGNSSAAALSESSNSCKRLIDLTEGILWSSLSVIGHYGKPEEFEDVTDKVCLDTSGLEE